MITEIEIQGFKSLRNVTLPLSPGITLLVGANNSGKSNVLQVLQLLGDSAARGLRQALAERAGASAALFTRGAHRAELAVRSAAERRNPEPTYSIAWEAKGADVRESGRGSTTASRLAAARTVDLAPVALRAESVPAPGVRLESDGRNLAAVLDQLSNTQPAVFERIFRAVHASASEVTRIVMPSVGTAGAKVVGVEEGARGVFPASEVSDGLLLLIAVATVIELAGGGPGLLGIEEPEKGIHPRRVRDVVDHLRRVAQNGTQVVATTHSPLVLDEFRDSPESVLILDRDDSGTRVTRLSEHPDWSEDLAREGRLSDLWYSGILGGVPR